MTVRRQWYEAQAVTRLTLDRVAKGNSLSAELVGDLAAALQACHHDGTRLLLIDAAGANFCTGFDLSNLDEESDDTLLARFVRVELLLQQLYRAPFLTVAIVQGQALGAGADLAAACSQRWIGADATFMFPGAGFGLVLGTARLAARVGAAQAEAWVACGTRIDAAAALSSGLASQRPSVAGSEVAGSPRGAGSGARGGDGSGDRNAGADRGAEIATVLALAESMKRIDAGTLAAIRAAAEVRGPADDALDMARLVRSAAVPGLRERIMAYRAASLTR